jgi:hypothetical protein
MRVREASADSHEDLPLAWVDKRSTQAIYQLAQQEKAWNVNYT